MRYLGIDYGDRRIGLAVSDPAGKIAFPKKVIFNRGTGSTLNQLKSFIESEEISQIIIGLPLAHDGGETEQSKKVRQFAKELEKFTPLPLAFENEILSSHMAERAGVKREHTDEAAAALILQSYLDRNAKL